jgi:LPS export ABC transporter protein LptC
MAFAKHSTYLIPALMGAGIFFSCTTNSIEEVLEYSDSAVPPLRTTLNAFYTYTDSGRVQNTLAASHIEQFQQGDSTYSLLSGGFELVFFNREGGFDGKLTAINGFINGRNTLMIARDSVVFVNANNETLRTEELIWLQDSNLVFTRKFVTIERESGTIYGRGLESDQNFTHYTIKEPTGFLYIQEADEAPQP